MDGSERAKARRPDCLMGRGTGLGVILVRRLVVRVSVLFSRLRKNGLDVDLVSAVLVGFSCARHGWGSSPFVA
jgi:hypothetical protein